MSAANAVEDGRISRTLCGTGIQGGAKVMTRRAILVTMTAALGGLTGTGVPRRLAPGGGVALAADDGDGWKALWNGTDFSGWETYLGRPNRRSDVPGLTRNDQGNYPEALGVDKDPTGVFSVAEVDGKPAIRISGEVYGALTTKEEYENYHLRFQIKWGTKQWPPRETGARDSGCLYHCVGPHGAGSGAWMQSLECQVQEHDCGDFFSVVGVIVDVEALRRDAANSRSPLVFTKGAPKVIGTTQRIIRNPENDKLTEWNTIEVLCVGQTSVHVVNGKVNMIMTGLRRKVDGQEVPLTKGRLQFQSEAAEVFYRNIELRPLSAIPPEYL
jgi:3-keto-disaccharide hydrolase